MQFFRDMGFWGRSIALILLSITMFIIFMVIGDILAVLIFGKDQVVHTSNGVLLLLQAFMALGVFVVPSVTLAIMCANGNTSWERLSLSPKPKITSIIICVAIMLVVQPMVKWLEDINLCMTLPDCLSEVEDWMRVKEDRAMELTRRLLGTSSPVLFACNILVLAVLPAVGEELYFRVGLQKTILCETTSIRKFLAALISAFVFSAIHLQFFGFLPRFVLGFVLGAMLIETGSVWCSIIAHFVNNAMAVILGFVEQSGDSVAVNSFVEQPWAIVASLLLFVALSWLLHRTEKKSEK